MFRRREAKPMTWSVVVAAPKGTAAWCGRTRLDLAQTGSLGLEEGTNKLTLRVPVTLGAGHEVQVEVRKTKDSPRSVDVVGGQ